MGHSGKALTLISLMLVLLTSTNALAIECLLDSDCPLDSICDVANNVCLYPEPGHCFFDYTCEDWEVCDLGVCTIANTCVTNADCTVSGETCNTTLGACMTVFECFVEDDCPLGEVCLSGLCRTDVKADRDRDGVPDILDNCLTIENTDQDDQDSDGIGNKCDQEIDGDGVLNDSDNCPLVVNVSQSDRDSNGTGDACEPDSDFDGVPDDVDNCPNDANSGQDDFDGDGLGDLCDPDLDGDGLGNQYDSCPEDPINGPVDDPQYPQPDLDDNGISDFCEDLDADGVSDVYDNCIIGPGGGEGSRFHNGAFQSSGPSTGLGYWRPCEQSSTSGEHFCYDVRNPSQSNLDNDRFGDGCDTDLDGDGVLNADDNCVFVHNTLQEKYNSAVGPGRACDLDWDSDGINNELDNCPDSVGEGTSQIDSDGDTFGDLCDLCPDVPSASNTDKDSDGRGDACDTDMDGDGWLNNDDNCPGTANADQADSNTDGIGNVCQ